MIRQIIEPELALCVEVIRKSFLTVAEELGFTEEDAPRFTAFATTEDRLRHQLLQEKRPMYGFFEGSVLAGYYSLSLRERDACELNNLCVLPAYRHKGIGGRLLDHAFQTAKALGCGCMEIGIVEENQVLRRWYEANGFLHIGTKKFDFFPFTCGYMKKTL